MLEGDLIIHTPHDQASIDSELESILKYALLSLPFTINRMKLNSIYGRLLNIIKGKLAESWLKDWSLTSGKYLDFHSGSSPFWQRDLYDFKYDGHVYDLKNNFIHADGILTLADYLRLPALIPNRHGRDQWSQRMEMEYGPKAFLFSFISQGKEGDKNTMLNLWLPKETEYFLQAWCNEVGDQNPVSEPYSEGDFWKALLSKSQMPKLRINRIPSLVISAQAKQADFDKFEDTDDHEAWGYAHYGKRWYNPRPQGGLSFCNGLIQTRIRNATCPIEMLAAFK